MLNGAELALESRLEEVGRALRHVRDFCAEVGLGVGCERILDVVVEELIANTVRHGRPAPDAPIRLRLTRRGAAIELRYADRAPPFDFTADLPPDARDHPAEARPIGGLGWPLILHYARPLSCEAGPRGNRYVFELSAGGGAAAR